MLCLKSFAKQSVLPSEVLVADDGSGSETRELIERMRVALQPLFSVVHVWHEDIGVRKAQILNEAVRRSSGEYLIFTDGDCLAHRHFVRTHVENSEPDAILGGRRVEVGKRLTERLQGKCKIINSFTIELLLDSVFGNSRRVEESILIRNRYLRRLLHRDFITPDGIWGCNFSLYKELFMAVNGCDEDFIDLSLEDNDIGIRVLNRGGKMISVRGLAIVYHLWHETRWNFNDEKYLYNLAILERRIANREMACIHGIQKLDSQAHEQVDLLINECKKNT